MPDDDQRLLVGRKPVMPQNAADVLTGNSVEWTRHLEFRDWLRVSPVDAARYSELKRHLVTVSDSRNEYRRLKASFIDTMKSGT